MEAMTKKAEGQTGGRVTFKKAAIPLLLSSVIVLGIAAGKTPFLPAGEESGAKDPPTQPASCRLVLAPLTRDKPIDQEIAQQQALIARSSSSATTFERLGWLFVKKARLSFDTGFYKLAEQCAACPSDVSGY